MSDILQTGADFLAATLKARASREITYTRGASQVTVKVTIGKTLLRLEDEFGAIQMVWTERDYLMTLTDLVLDGVQTLPREADLIRDVEGGVTKIYEVLPYGGEPTHKVDAHNAILRVHTKFIRVE